jgi:hypothetical protein
MAVSVSPDPAPEEIGRVLRALGWRQGGVLSSAALREAGAIVPDDSRDGLVVSHDCDVLSHDLAKEPYVEVVPFTVLRTSRPLESAAQHARQLALTLTGPTGTPTEVSLVVHDRVRLDRRVLLRHRPSDRWSISDEARFILGEWMARRYLRPAFPDAFNDRLRASRAQDALRRLMRRWGSLAEQILVRLDTDAELEPAQLYRIAVLVVTTREVAENADLRVAVERELYEPMVSALEQSQGIEVIGATLVGEHQVTLERAGEFKQWHPDALSSLPG